MQQSHFKNTAEGTSGCRMEPAKNEDADKDAAIARRRKLSLPPPTVKLIEESDLLQQSLYQGGGGVGASRQDQHEVRPGSDAHIARSKNLLCICMHALQPRLQGAGGIRSPVKSKAYPAYNR